MIPEKRKLIVLLLATVLLVNVGLVSSASVVRGLRDTSQDRYPAMIPVSSTVIPLLHLFGKPKPLQGGGATSKPRALSSTYLSPARRMRLLERSRRPEEPVRLITKNSKQKDLNNETH